MLPTSGIVTLSSGLTRTRIMASLIRKRSNLEWVSISIPCSALALALSLFFRDAAAKRVVPAIFLLALVAVAYLFGRLASLLAAIAAVLIFAVFLFEPYGSLAVDKATDRVELLCFAVFALVMICFPPQTSTLRKLAQKQFKHPLRLR